MHFQTDLESIDRFAAAFWKQAGNTRVFAFHGEMGAGKTTTIAAICRHKGIMDAVSSPTFSIINEYFIPGANKQPNGIFHIDLYRLKNAEEIVQAGVQDCIDSGNYCFVEWPEKAPWLFENDAVHVTISLSEDGQRQVDMLKPGEWSWPHEAD